MAISQEVIKKNGLRKYTHTSFNVEKPKARNLNFFIRPRSVKGGANESAAEFGLCLDSDVWTVGGNGPRSIECCFNIRQLVHRDLISPASAVV